MARVDYDQMAVSYDRGRALSPEGLEGWRAALTVWLPPTGGLPVLDLGAGTGLFATAIASWFDVAVVAAERLPLRDGCCGGAWLSTVIHHLADLPGCARELRRVLRAGGPMLIRNSFPDRHQGISLFGAGRIADTFPTVEATAAAFEADSTLQLLPDEEFVKGLAALERAAARRPRLRSSTTSTCSCFADHEEEHG